MPCFVVNLRSKSRVPDVTPRVSCCARYSDRRGAIVGRYRDSGIAAHWIVSYYVVLVSALLLAIDQSWSILKGFAMLFQYSLSS